jgi:hypothetical protein
MEKNRKLCHILYKKIRQHCKLNLFCGISGFLCNTIAMLEILLDGYNDDISKVRKILKGSAVCTFFKNQNK